MSNVKTRPQEIFHSFSVALLEALPFGINQNTSHIKEGSVDGEYRG